MNQEENLVKHTHDSWRAFRDYMATVDGVLQADDKRFEGTALVMHPEGILLQDRASVEVHEIINSGPSPSDFVLVVFGEHMHATHFDLDGCKWANFKMHRPYEVLPPEPEDDE